MLFIHASCLMPLAYNKAGSNPTYSIAYRLTPHAYFWCAMSIRVRFAPSPTGYLHIGGVRTALYNFLFARQNKGAFVLRIEDTDSERSDTTFTESILRSMDWLGLKPDEGPGINEKFSPYYQSERKQKGIYKEYADKLLADGKAYYCYCTPEELDAKRKQAMTEKKPPRYDGTCRNQGAGGREQGAGKKVVRFKNDNEGAILLNDLIRGEISFDKKNLDDFIIVKSDGLPVYNFACVVDDALMEISHVIRGDDHISNTPRQILLYEALGFPLPQFAHIPMILGSDKARLSKRHGATSVEAYKEDGYLPEAMLNFLARLGWAYDDKQEIFSMAELIEKFSLEAVSKNPAVFNPEKLLWLNSHYIMQKADDALANMILEVLESQGMVKGTGYRVQGAGKEKEVILKAIPLIKERMKTLKEAAALLDFFFVDEVKIDEQAKQKFLTKPETLAALKDMAHLLSDTEPFTHAELETRIRQFVDEKKIKLKDILQPLRVILTGKSVSPPLLESMEILGKETTLARLNKFLAETR